MRSMYKFLAAGAGAAVLGLAGQSSAAIYDLTVNHCAGCVGSTFGTVTVTGTTTLNIAVDLANNVYFNQAGNGFDAVTFNLLNDPTVTVAGEAANFTVNGTNNNSAVENAGNLHEDGLGFFEYFVDWLGPPTNNGNLFTGGVQHLSFTVTGASALALEGNGQNPNVFFTVDVAQLNADHVVIGTGPIGATLRAGVPEPATWTMMIAGFGGIGALMRRRRQQGVAAVA